MYVHQNTKTWQKLKDITQQYMTLLGDVM